MSPGKTLRHAMQQEKPLQLIGVMNAYVALMAKDVGYKALYLSGAGVANSSYGLPDLGMTTLDNVLEDARRILSIVDLPLVVDIDTGWGSSLMIQRTIKEMIKVGVAGVHLEDQPFLKRCGHLEGKSIVSTEEMVSRIKSAVQAKSDSDFFIIARTDAFAVEGFEKTLERTHAYLAAGADAIFPEALPSLEDFKKLKKAINAPILANMTEFGKTPLLTREELASVPIDLALYPLSVNRAMNLAALKVLTELKKKGSQLELTSEMQTREELYHYLNYPSYQEKER